MLVIIVICLIIIFIRRSFYIITVQGLSMKPTLQHGDRILIFRLWHKKLIRHKQIIVFYPLIDDINYNKSVKLIPNNIIVVKRVIGLPGDIISRHKRSQLYYVEVHKNPYQYDEKNYQYWIISENHFFVKGDAPSIDSFIWGPIVLNPLIGVMVLKFPKPTI